MKIKQWLSVAALSVSAVFSASTLAEEPLKVGFIYVGAIGDMGWSYEHDQARQEMEKHFGDKEKQHLLKTYQKVRTQSVLSPS